MSGLNLNLDLDTIVHQAHMQSYATIGSDGSLVYKELSTATKMWDTFLAFFGGSSARERWNERCEKRSIKAVVTHLKKQPGEEVEAWILKNITLVKVPEKTESEEALAQVPVVSKEVEKLFQNAITEMHMNMLAHATLESRKDRSSISK
jgi:hypothetical protein